MRDIVFPGDGYRHLEKEKDPVIDVIRTELQRSGMTLESVARISGVSKNTIRGWLFGKTRRPQRMTTDSVLRTLGVDTTLHYRDSGKPARRDARVLASFWRQHQLRRQARQGRGKRAA